MLTGVRYRDSAPVPLLAPALFALAKAKLYKYCEARDAAILSSPGAKVRLGLLLQQHGVAVVRVSDKPQAADAALMQDAHRALRSVLGGGDEAVAVAVGGEGAAEGSRGQQREPKGPLRDQRIARAAKAARAAKGAARVARDQQHAAERRSRLAVAAEGAERGQQGAAEGSSVGSSGQQGAGEGAAEGAGDEAVAAGEAGPAEDGGAAAVRGEGEGGAAAGTGGDGAAASAAAAAGGAIAADGDGAGGAGTAARTRLMVVVSDDKDFQPLLRSATIAGWRTAAVCEDWDECGPGGYPGADVTLDWGLVMQGAYCTP
jgi:hypothetical protein